MRSTFGEVCPVVRGPPREPGLCPGSVDDGDGVSLYRVGSSSVPRASGSNVMAHQRTVFGLIGPKRRPGTVVLGASAFQGVQGCFRASGIIMRTHRPRGVQARIVCYEVIVAD